MTIALFGFAVIRLDGSTPTKYGLRLNMEEKYRGLKQQLTDLSGIPALQILLVEIFGALVKVRWNACKILLHVWLNH